MVINTIRYLRPFTTLVVKWVLLSFVVAICVCLIYPDFIEERGERCFDEVCTVGATTGMLLWYGFKSAVRCVLEDVLHT